MSHFTLESTLGKKVATNLSDQCIIDAHTIDALTPVSGSIIFDGTPPTSEIVTARISFGSGGMSTQLNGKIRDSITGNILDRPLKVYPGLVLPVRGTDFRVEILRTAGAGNFGAYLAADAPSFPAVILLGSSTSAAVPATPSEIFTINNTGKGIPFLSAFVKAIKVVRSPSEPFKVNFGTTVELLVGAGEVMDWLELGGLFDLTNMFTSVIENQGAANFNFSVLAQLSL